MHLAKQQPGGHAQAEVQHRPVCLRHLLALEERVRPVVDDLGIPGAVVEGEEDPGPDQDQERVQGDLAEQE